MPILRRSCSDDHDGLDTCFPEQEESHAISLSHYRWYRSIWPLNVWRMVSTPRSLQKIHEFCCIWTYRWSVLTVTARRSTLTCSPIISVALFCLNDGVQCKKHVLKSLYILLPRLQNNHWKYCWLLHFLGLKPSCFCISENRSFLNYAEFLLCNNPLIAYLDKTVLHEKIPKCYAIHIHEWLVKRFITSN